MGNEKNYGDQFGGRFQPKDISIAECHYCEVFFFFVRNYWEEFGHIYVNGRFVKSKGEERRDE